MVVFPPKENDGQQYKYEFIEEIGGPIDVKVMIDRFVGKIDRLITRVIYR